MTGRYGLTSPALAEAVDALQRHRSALGYSGKYVAAEARAAAEGLRFFEGRGVRTLSDVTAADVAAYYRYLARRPNYRRADAGPLHAATREHLARAVRTLLGVAVACGWVASDASSAVGRGLYAGGARGERRALSREAVGRLYAAADALPAAVTLEGRSRGALTRPLARAILAAVYGCGLRVAEASALDRGDVDVAGARLTVRRGKGGRRRSVPLAPGVVRDLGEYFAACRADLLGLRSAYAAATAAVLVNGRGRRMRGPTVNRHLAALSEAAGIAPAATAHVLRHSIATHLLSAGVGVELVRVLLGHAHLESTQAYTHVTPGLLDDLVRDDLVR